MPNNIVFQMKIVENQDYPESNLVLKIALIQTIKSNLMTIHSTTHQFSPYFISQTKNI